MQEILIILCTVIASIHLVYYLFILKFYRHPVTKNKPLSKIPVSVIVCARNEEENLKKLVPLLIKQKHFNFEIILINDRSYDGTEDLIDKFKTQNSNIKTVNVRDTDFFIGHKKYALTLGIKVAKHDCLLLTDADCEPSSEYWITEMSSNFNTQKTIVLGYGAYKTQKSFLNKLIRYETVITALQYFSYAINKTPYMGVGRNLMYSKTLFLKHKGFNTHLKIMSGDDDLLINQISTNNNTSICIQQNAFTNSIPKTSIRTYFTQKRRHISTAKHYKFKHQILLGLYAINRLLFWIIFPLSFIVIKAQNNLILLSCLIFLKFLSEYIVVGITAKKLNEKKITLFTPVFDFILLLIQIMVFVFNLFEKPKHWS